MAGGEKFQAVIGPSRAFRRVTRLLLGGSLVVALGSILAAQRGAGTGVFLIAAAVLFAGSISSGWLSGGTEALVCQGRMLTHRRIGVLRDRRRAVAMVDVLRVRAPGPGVRNLPRGVRIETIRGTWAVGRRLPEEEARLLGELLLRHLALSPEQAMHAMGAKTLSPGGGRPIPAPIPSEPETVLRARNPPVGL